MHKNWKVNDIKVTAFICRFRRNC